LEVWRTLAISVVLDELFFEMVLIPVVKGIGDGLDSTESGLIK
jgi:hypothetical protein